MIGRGIVRIQDRKAFITGHDGQRARPSQANEPRDATNLLRGYPQVKIGKMKRSVYLILAGVLTIIRFNGTTEAAQFVVPGTGALIDYVGDDFEDPEWRYIHQHPKSSRENDERSRAPLGYSENGRWVEGPERGGPDYLKVVATPEGGLPGSQYALLMRTLHSGIPGRLSYDVQQDDLIVNCISRLGTMVRESEMPNCVVRIYLPPAEQWENRSGPHFGFRMGLTTTTQQKSRGLFASRRPTTEPYWPGMWIHFRSEGSRGVESDSAFIKVRGDRYGRDFEVLEIDQFGWWTLGMSMTADGAIHYFASPGVDALTAEDHLTTQFPYSFRGERFRTFFFNVCNRNDGASWSTPFVIDDPQLFLVDASRINAIVQQKKERELAQETARRQKEAATTGR